MSTVTIILKILPYVLCAGVPSFFFIRKNIQDRKTYKTEIAELKKLNLSIVSAEKEKNLVRKKHNEIQEAIISDPTGDNVTVMPTLKTGEHNHSFRSECTADCPAYTGD